MSKDIHSRKQRAKYYKDLDKLENEVRINRFYFNSLLGLIDLITENYNINPDKPLSKNDLYHSRLFLHRLAYKNFRETEAHNKREERLIKQGRLTEKQRDHKYNGIAGINKVDEFILGNTDRKKEYFVRMKAILLTFLEDYEAEYNELNKKLKTLTDNFEYNITEEGIFYTPF